MQIPCGILVDKFGQKIMLMCGFTLFIIGTLSIAKATGLVMIYAGSLMAGAGCASFFSSAYSLSSANVPQARRALANAIINSGSAIGMGNRVNRFQRAGKKHEHGGKMCCSWLLPFWW